MNERALWKELYALPNINLLKVKQAMENHIQVEETSVLRHSPPHFSKEKNLPKRSPKQDCYPMRDNNPRKS